MREIEKMMIKEKFLESFYRQKHLQEETLMEMFGRNTVLQMSKKYTLSSQQPNATNETSNKALVLHKGVQMTLGGPSLDDQDRREERLVIHKEGGLPTQLHSGGIENTKGKMLLNYSLSSQHPKATNENSNEDPTVLHKGAQMPSMGGGSSFVSDMEGGPCLDDQDRHEQRLGIHEEGGLSFQLHPGSKENTKPNMTLNWGRETSTPNQPKTPNLSYFKIGFGTRTSTPMVSSVKECAPGTKENIDTPLVDGNDETSCNSTKKENWECQLCHVMTNNKKLLEEHNRGKMHKKKEKAARESGIISPTIKESVEENMEAQHEEDLDKICSGPSVKEKDKVSSVKECAPGTKENTDTQLIDGNDETSCKSTGKENWECQLCHVMTNNKKLLEEHYRGKKHKKKKKKAARESGIISPTIKESVEENMEAQHEEDLDKLCSGPSVEEKDEIVPGENAFGTKRKIAPTEEEQGNETASASHPNKKTKQGKCETTSKFWCQVCKFGTMTAETMINHRMGKEHIELMQMNGGSVIVETHRPGDVRYVEAGKLLKLVSGTIPKY